LRLAARFARLGTVGIALRFRSSLSMRLGAQPVHSAGPRDA
jgi:hypothetical protein